MEVPNAHKTIDDEIERMILSSKHHSVRYDSLGMMGSDTIEANEELGDAHFSGIDRQTN